MNDISLWDKIEIVLAGNLNHKRWLGYIPLKRLIKVDSLFISFRQIVSVGVAWMCGFTNNSRNMCLTI